MRGLWVMGFWVKTEDEETKTGDFLGSGERRWVPPEPATSLG
jgi:hypothetical protein